MPSSSLPVPVVDPAWLAPRLAEPDLAVVDASWYLPAAGRDPRAEYRAGHVPGAVFWDLDALSDAASPLPHTMPAPAALAQDVGRLGLATGDRIVVYDGSGVNLSAARAWWMLRALGHGQVAVLDGGLAAWRAAGLPLEAGEVRRPPARFEPRPADARFISLPELLARVGSGAAVVDARGLGRFTGEEPEPRPGLRSGHIPGSRHLHYADLVGPDGRLRPPDELRRRFDEARVPLDRPVVTTCGSGVSACALILALEQLGHRDHAVYDGSWAEYGGRDDLPVERGPPR